MEERYRDTDRYPGYGFPCPVCRSEDEYRRTHVKAARADRVPVRYGHAETGIPDTELNDETVQSIWWNEGDYEVKP